MHIRLTSEYQRLGKPQEEEGAMKVDTSHKQARRCEPWTALCVLSLVTVMILVAPSVVFAKSVAFSLDCEKALLNTERTVTATVTDDNGGPAANLAVGFSIVSGANSPQRYQTSTDGAGIAQLTYTDTGPNPSDERIDKINFYDMSAGFAVLLDFTDVYWTPDDQDPVLLSCMEPSAQTVNVGGHGKLNVKKKGAMRIMVCSDGELDLFSVDPETVTLAGVKPERWKYKDIRYCAGGKDGFVDLVFKFKNRKIVEALEGVLARELVDDDKVELDLAGSLDDGTPLEGTYAVEIIKKDKKAKRCKKKKMAKK